MFEFLPITNTFTKTIRLSPTFGKSYFSQIDISGIRGSSEAIFDVFGIGLAWGAPFEGWGGEYNKINGFFVGRNESDYITKTTLTYDVFKLRHYVKLIDDGSSKMALFASIGQFHGHAMVKEQSETLDKSSEVERFASGGIGDVGCVFSYQLNRDWDIFIQSLYQGSFGVKTETIFSEPSADVELSITGALVQIGTSLKL